MTSGGGTSSSSPEDLIRPVPDTPEGRVAAAAAYGSSAETPSEPSIRQPSTSTRGLARGSRSTSQEVRQFASTYCPASVTHTHDEGSRRDGRCTWCERKFKAAAQRPNLTSSYPTDLDREYRRAYDPDYGDDYYDA